MTAWILELGIISELELIDDEVARLFRSQYRIWIRFRGVTRCIGSTDCC